MDTLPFAYFEGKVTPLQEAKISIASNTLHYGTNCFAGIRGYVVDEEVRIFRLKDHYNRLMRGVKIMGIDFRISEEDFEKIIAELVVRNGPDQDFYIRPIVFSATERIGPKLTGLTFQLGVYCMQLGQYFDMTRGMRLMISSWRKFSDIMMSTKAKAGGCYVNSFLASNEAIRCGYDEALMTDQNGMIVEASVANILLSYRGRLLTPPGGAAALEGITLRTMVELLQEEGLEVCCEAIDRSMVYTCDELLVLGTAAQVCFAESVDGRLLGENPGPICELLRRKFSQVIAKEHPKSREWLTVYS